MNNPMDEAEFEAYIRRRSSLSRSYQNLVLESPPRELDEAVMSLAREAHTLKRPQRREVYMGWMAPVAFAATVVLVFTVALQIVIRPHLDSTLADSERPLSNIVDSHGSREQPAAASAPAAPVSDKTSATEHQVVASPAGALSSEMALEEANAAAPRPGLRAEAEKSGSIREPTADSGRESVTTTGSRADAIGRPVVDVQSEVGRTGPALLNRTAIATSAPTKEPKAWLARIERLRRDGQAAAADEQMKEFFTTYPDYFRTHTPPPDTR